MLFIKSCITSTSSQLSSYTLLPVPAQITAICAAFPEFRQQAVPLPDSCPSRQRHGWPAAQPFAVQRTHGVLRQLLRTAKSVLSALHPAADNLHDILDNRRHSLMHSRKCTGINAVRMDYGTSLRISVVNSGVHLQFGRRNALALNNFAITVDYNNVLRRQCFIAMTGGCDSNILRVNTAADVAPRACNELFSISAWPVSTMAAHTLSLANNCVSMIIRQPDMPFAHHSGCRCPRP